MALERQERGRQSYRADPLRERHSSEPLSTPVDFSVIMEANHFLFLRSELSSGPLGNGRSGFPNQQLFSVTHLPTSWQPSKLKWRGIWLLPSAWTVQKHLAADSINYMGSSGGVFLALIGLLIRLHVPSTLSASPDRADSVLIDPKNHDHPFERASKVHYHAGAGTRSRVFGRRDRTREFWRAELLRPTPNRVRFKLRSK